MIRPINELNNHSQGQDLKKPLIKRIGYHLDEHIDPGISKALRHYGIRITTPLETGLRTQGDAAQLMLACQQQQVIVTHDATFLRFTQSQGIHFGIVYCHPLEPGTSDLIRRLILIYEVLTPEEMIGNTEVL